MKVFAKVEHWHGLLERSPPQFLREALDGPMTFTAEGKQYRFEGMTATGALIEALIGDSHLAAPRKGTAPRRRR